ncbi:hypothetical protein V2O64_11940 [Verrucomicrobiaceae bacterium 227]
MKSLFLHSLTFATLLGLPCGLAAQDTYLFDFGGDPTFMGPAPDDPVNVWNHIGTATGNSETGVLADLQDRAGNVAAGMNLEMVRRFAGTNSAGHPDSALFPGNASRDTLYGNTEEFGGQRDVFPAFKLTGLDSSLSYDFTFYAARLGVSDNRETQYTITGANAAVALLNPSNNESDLTVTSTGILPNASGEILVELAPGAANDNSVHFTYLGVLKLESSPSSGNVVITTEPESVTVTEFDPVTFRVTATGAGPFSVQWYENGTEIPGATDFSYAIPETSLALDGFSYTATVSNDTSSESTSAATLTVEADIIRPSAISVGANGSAAIVLTFSEPLDPAKGAATSSYSVSDALGLVGITSATLSENGTEVQLVMARQVSGEFTVSVAGVADRAGNLVDPTMNTISGIAAAPGVVSYLFDFGGGIVPTDPANSWNLLSTTIGQDEFGVLGNIVATTGEASTYTIEMITRFTGTNTAGATSSALYPGDATGDSLYGNSEEWQGLSEVFPSFKLTGLDNNNSHTLTFYAARLGAGDNRETKYTVIGRDGEVSVLFNPADNSTDETVKIEEIYPDEAGEITVTLTPGENNNNSFHFTYLNALRLDTAPGNSQGLRITDFQFEQATNELSLIWTAGRNATYSVFYTDDLTDLKKGGDIEDSITDNGPSDSDPEPGRIRFQFANPDLAKSKLFFSVHKNE